MTDQIPDKLIEIPSSKWSVLRDMYLRDWPMHVLGYYTLDNYVQWNKIKSDINNLQIYSLNGDWQRDGTFVVVDRYEVFLNTLNNGSVNRILRILVQLDWKHSVLVSSFLSKHRPAVLEAVLSKQLTTEYDLKGSLYYMSSSEAAAINIVLHSCPEGISLRPMSQDHAVIADEAWPHRRQGSLFLSGRKIDWNLNVGAFNDDGKLVAWCLRAQNGALANLYVDSNYKRRGLGTLVAKAMTKKLSELNMDIFAVIRDDNVASICVFEKIGFRVVDSCYYLSTYSLGAFDWID